MCYLCNHRYVADCKTLHTERKETTIIILRRERFQQHGVILKTAFCINNRAGFVDPINRAFGKANRSARAVITDDGSVGIDEKRKRETEFLAELCVGIGVLGVDAKHRHIGVFKTGPIVANRTKLLSTPRCK